MQGYNKLKYFRDRVRKWIPLIELSLNIRNETVKCICDWIKGNQSKSHIESYEIIIDLKDFETL